MNYIRLDYIAASKDWAQYDQQTLISPTAPASGDAVGSTVNGNYSCLVDGGTCTRLQSYFPMQPASSTSDIAGGQGIFGTTVDISTGAIGFPEHRVDYWFYGPRYGQSTNSFKLWDEVRCDNALPGSQNNVRCVVYKFIPSMVYSLSGPFPELAGHILVAQNSDLPGAPGGTPLRRLTDQTKINANRTRACGSYTPPPGSGKSCDEYPMASTHEGASTANPQGTARTFPGCSISAPTGVTGPTGYSVCMINATQNSTGGSVLNSELNVPNRVIENDPFYISITP